MSGNNKKLALEMPKKLPKHSHYVPYSPIHFNHFGDIFYLLPSFWKYMNDKIIVYGKYKYFAVFVSTKLPNFILLSQYTSVCFIFRSYMLLFFSFFKFKKLSACFLL